MYCVRTRMRRSPECRQLLSVKSMMRYRPPKGTAGLARSAVSGYRREPAPPARMMLIVFSCMGPSIACRRGLLVLPQVADPLVDVRVDRVVRLGQVSRGEERLAGVLHVVLADGIRED